MVINISEVKLDTIVKIEEFLYGSAEVKFTPDGCEAERYAHISRVLQRRPRSCFHRLPISFFTIRLTVA